MDFASSFVKQTEYDAVIAVDGGLAAADALGVCPTHLVGDFDTIRPDILEKYRNRPDVRVHAYDPEKDNTDTDIAVLLAIRLCEGKEKESKIHILGALGSRADHMLANLMLLLKPHSAGVAAFIIDRTNRIRVAQGDVVLRREEAWGDYVSLIPLTKKLGGRV